MRLYIRKRTNGPHCPEYEFAKSIEAALYWQSSDWVGRVCDLIDHEGITIDPPFRGGVRPHCSGFLVEPRPQGGFVISCEVPV